VGLTDILNTARDAMSAQTFGLTVTGQNVANVNTPGFVRRQAMLETRDMGDKNIVKIDPLMVSEDFGRFGLDGKIPTCMLNVGAVDPAKIASGARLPSLHSSEFAPVPDATLRGAVKAMTVSVMELMR